MNIDLLPAQLSSKSTLLLSFLSKILLIISQISASALVTYYLTPGSRDVYFLLLSIASVQIVFELGLGQFITISVASTSSKEKERVLPDTAIKLLKYGHLTYKKYSILLAALSMLIATFILTLNNSNNFKFYLLVSIFFILTQSCRFYLLFFESALEGLGQVRYVFITRSTYSLIYTMVFMVCIFFELNLLAMFFANLSILIISYTFYSRKYKILFSKIFERMNHIPEKEVLVDRTQSSFRSRVSITWIASYLITNLPVLISFSSGSQGLAAQVGLASQFASVVGVVSAAITSPRLTIASAYAGSQDWVRFSHLLSSTLRFVLLASSAAAAFGVLSVYLIHALFSPDVSAALPSTITTAFFIANSLIYVFMFNISFFYRAMLVEPFVRAICGSACLTAVTVGIAAVYGEAADVGLAQLACSIAIIAPSAAFGYKKLKLEMFRLSKRVANETT